jgi:outer membrane protein assembly factor BamB
MSVAQPEWLQNGTGLAPRVAWSFGMDAELTGLEMARETGEIFAVDASGGVCRSSRQGKIEAISRGLHNVRFIRWSDTGDTGLVVADTSQFSIVDRDLNVVWTSKAPWPILGGAVDAYGHNVAVSLEDGNTVLFSVDKKKLGQFSTIKSLSFLKFVTGKPGLIGAAEYGHLCRHNFEGKELWNEKLWATVGDLSISGDGKLIFLAEFAHGIQSYDPRGNSLANYVVEGTPSRLSVSFFGERLVTCTAERYLYWLDADGALLWAAEAPDEIVSLHCDPLGEWFVAGFKSGRVMRLDWESQK